jgi:cytochrome b subunit of formate dehydrogenase
MLSKVDPNSLVFPLNIPQLCAKCHQEGKSAAVRYKGKQHSISTNYAESIHGKGLMKSGLTVTATCADCHSAHKSLPKDDPNSSINPKNVSGTCGKCHFGIEEDFHKSIHSPNVSKTDKKLPVCYDCHSAHSIRRIDEGSFRYQILSTCGKCHSEIAETYFDTYHGKVSRLGSSRSAKCGDCHGSHNILSIYDPNSSISRSNIVGTCQKCHKNATKGFTKYLSHATHHDKDKYPWLFYTFWGMTFLLLGTFSMSFLHTLLWLPRSLQMRKKMKHFHTEHSNDKNPKLYQRFSALNRLLHFTMIVSFLALAATGMVLKFSYTPWSQIISSLMGGVDNAGLLHRFAATMLFGVFFAHIIDLTAKKKNEYASWKAMLFDKDSMIPNKKDWKDIKDSIKWFLGKGGRPNYGRWTYWEKFDYFAVFWGIFVIGGTGLTLWFPVLLTKIIPGSFINVATIIHSDEALLAAGFIFTVHFFNTHFRPEKFPMDTVIFSGQMTIEELKLERPAEYNALVENGELEKYMRPPFSKKMLKLLKIFGWIALGLGLSMVVWIIYGLILS